MLSRAPMFRIKTFQMPTLVTKCDAPREKFCQAAIAISKHLICRSLAAIPLWSIWLLAIYLSRSRNTIEVCRWKSGLRRWIMISQIIDSSKQGEINLSLRSDLSKFFSILSPTFRVITPAIGISLDGLSYFKPKSSLIVQMLRSNEKHQAAKMFIGFDNETRLRQEAGSQSDHVDEG